MTDQVHDEDVGDDEAIASGGVALRSVEEHYDRVAHYYSTRTSDGYQAIDKHSRDQVLLWLLRHPIAVQSGAAQRFVSRFDLLNRLTGITPAFRGYGVDQKGVAFLVTDFIEGMPLVEVKSNMSALQSLYLDALRKVAVLHQRGLLLGDICDHSFVVNRSNKVLLAAALGTFEVEASQTAMLPPASTLHYVSPEQRSGSGVDFASDVYALGVLGYRLFTGRYMFGDKPPMLGADDQMKLVPAPSVLVKAAPTWCDPIIGRCTEPHAADRYRDAGEMLEAIERVVKTGEIPSGGGRWSQPTMVVHPTLPQVAPNANRAVAKDRRVSTPVGREQPKAPGLNTRSVLPKRELVISKGVLLFAASLVVGAFLAGIGFVVLQDNNDELIGAEFPIQPSDLPSELRPHLTDFFSAGIPVEQRKEALRAIALSDDPLSYSVLVYAVKQVSEVELRRSAEDLVLERINKEGLSNTSSLVGGWFKTVRGSQQEGSASLASVYSWILRACDNNLPIEARRTAIHKAYSEQPTIAIQLAAALTLDDGESKGSTDQFLPVLRQLVSAHLGQPGLADKGVGALLLSDKILSSTFSAKVLELLPKFSGEDLRWALGKLSQTDDLLLFKVARELVARNVLPPYQIVFLKALTETDPNELPSGVKKALVDGARGEISNQSIVEIGKWYDLQAEQVLLAICAVAKDNETRATAFDTLAARDIRSEPARSLVEWVRGRLWDERGSLAKSVGILGLIDRAGAEEIEYAFDALIPHSGQTSLLRVFVKSKIPSLIVKILERAGEVAPSGDLLPLLSNESKDVRRAAVMSLKDRNDLQVLQAVLRAYEEEKDDDVREVFRKTHWVIGDRAGAGQNQPSVGE